MTGTYRLLGVLLLAFVVAPALAEVDVNSPAYQSATAHDPNFADRTIWPASVEQTDFIKQEWPKARVLVFAKAGETIRGLDLNDAANWFEDGEPATSGPDEKTDVVFPTADKAYRINGNDEGFTCRHITVGSGVSISVRGGNVHGNMWIKKGATFAQGRPQGDANTFMRSDTVKPNRIANKILHNRARTSSIEWIGKWDLGDELDLFSGTFIVGPDATFNPGDRSVQRVFSDATLILMSGSTFQKRGSQYHSSDMEIEGVFLIGTPERPITKDVTLGLSRKHKGDARLSKPSDRGLVLYQKGKMHINSADPAKARLIIRENSLPAASHKLSPEEEKEMPKGIDMLLLGEMKFDGIEFHDVMKGGILLANPQTAATWEHVTYASDNLAAAAELVGKYTGSMDGKINPGGGIAGGTLLNQKKPASEDDK